MLQILKYSLLVINTFLTLFFMSQLILALNYFRKNKIYRSANKYNKFAIFIAARNEASVIADLINSLKNLNYPKDKYEIIVAPNNCTDNTEEIAKINGVRIFSVKNPVKSKGEVLNQLFDYFTKNENFDAFIVFDADNIVDKNYLNEMNKVIEEGYDIAQGYREMKNPYESFNSSIFSVYHYMINIFFQKARYRAGLNNIVTGSGFMTTKNHILNLNGWNTQTLTEDLEFSVISTLNKTKIVYNQDAIFYDEQPNDFITSWNQRVRWTTGIKQISKLKFKNIFKNFFKFGNIIQMYDTSYLVFQNIIITIGFFIQIINIIYLIHIWGFNYFLNMLFGTLIGLFVSPSILAIIIVLLAKKSIFKMWKGILGYGYFLAVWTVICVYVTLFKDNVEWKQVKHNSKIKIKTQL